MTKVITPFSAVVRLLAAIINNMPATYIHPLTEDIETLTDDMKTLTAVKALLIPDKGKILAINFFLLYGNDALVVVKGLLTKL
ncbi:MAG: hypothetical protein EOO00_03050 [Chitinophagaceae bacterium]|nr:MAG: hypothetical protein EOO00_03050 [Chitinophagaceae bacterium]